MRASALFPLFLASLLLAPAARAQDAAGPRHVPATDAEIAIDGRVDEPAWDRALRITLDYETRPGENVAARVDTECLLLHDRDRLYVAFRAHDPEPEKIRARLADRDDAWNDDFVGVVLDTFNDQRGAFEFFVNPLGVQMDVTFDDVNGNEDASWDTLWTSVGRLTETGYEVEFAIPFSSLRFPRAPGAQTWGIDALRFYPRDSRYRFANNPQDRGLNCYLCQLEKVTGFAGVTPGRNLEINPTLTAARTETRPDFPGGPLLSGEEESDLGLTLRWGITPDLSLSGTLNPDFSQVEADVAQLDVNTRFALFFPERRPFFLEGAELFSSPFDVVFSRNVADPTWGLKLTGKAGKNAHGVFVARDELTNLIFPGSQGSRAGSFDFESTDAVARYRRDLGAASSLGLLATSREGSGERYANRVFGVDTLWRLGASDAIEAQLLLSRTRYPDFIAAAFDQPAGAFDDHALRIAYEHDARLWDWEVELEDVGPGFRADMGFMPQVGYTAAEAGVERSWWGEADDFYTEIRVESDWERREDATGRRLEEEWEAELNLGGPRQSWLFVGAGVRDRFFNGVEFSETFYNFWSEIQVNRALWLGLFAGAGDEIDFANTRPGDQLRLEPELRWNLGRHLRLNLAHDYRRLDVLGGTLFTANLTQARIFYQLNLRTLVRAVFQYTDVVRDPDLYLDAVDARTERLFTQLLFSYKLNPRTVLFLGYSDNHRGDERIDLTRQNRTLFLKLGYAWVL